MDQQRASFSHKALSLALNPFGGAVILLSLLAALAGCFGGWPATVVDASIFLVTFELVTMLVVIFVISEDEDWKEDVKTGLRPLERARLTKLIFLHSWFTLATIGIALLVLYLGVIVGPVLAITIVISGISTMTVMLLGRR